MSKQHLKSSNIANQRPLSPYRITVAVPELGYGGAKKYSIVLANMLFELGADVTLLVFSRGDEELSQATKCPVKIIDICNDKSRLLRFYRRYRAYRLAKKESHIFISNLTGPNLLNALTYGSAAAIIVEHGSRIYDPNLTRRTKVFHQFFLDPMKFYFAKQIVSVSHGLTVEIANLAWGNVDKKMIVMYPPLDIDRKASDISKPEKIEFQKNLKKIRYICFVGRLSPEKGVLELLQIYKILSRTSPNIKLVIVGDGPIWDEAISLTQTLKIELNNFHENVPSIIFCGAVEDPKPILSHSEGLLVPSEVEAFGYVIIEGIEAGVPVFAADVPWGAREALTLGEEWRKEATARVEPQVTDFGFLLPRPHTRSAQKMWADAVVKSLTEKPRLIESAKLAISRQDRLSDFSVEHAKQKWASLILSLDRPF